jgi:hypothetical protein
MLPRTFGHLSYVAYELNRPGDAQMLLKRASAYLKSLKLSQTDKLEMVCNMGATLTALGPRAPYIEIDEGSARQSWPSRSRLSQEASIFRGAISLAVIFFTLNALAWLSTLTLLSSVARLWRKKFAESSGMPEKVLWLSRLTNLALFRKQFDLADKISRQLLSLVVDA